MGKTAANLNWRRVYAYWMRQGARAGSFAIITLLLLLAPLREEDPAIFQWEAASIGEVVDTPCAVSGG